MLLFLGVLVDVRLDLRVVLVRRDVVDLEIVVVFGAPVFVVLVQAADGTLLDRLGASLTARPRPLKGCWSNRLIASSATARSA